MRRALLTYLFLAFSFFPMADPATSEAEFSAGVIKDMVHSKDSDGIVLRYDYRAWSENGYGGGLGFSAFGWDDGGGGDDITNAFSLDYTLRVDLLDLSFGGAYISDVNSINGTHLNFMFGAGVNIWKLRVHYTHFSNAHNKNNQGWNFLGLSIVF